MKITFCLLTVDFDRLSGLNSRLAALVKGLAELGHQISVIQTSEAFWNSQYYYQTVSSLTVKPITVNFKFGKGFLYWASLVSLWFFPLEKVIPPDTEVLYIEDPLIRLPQKRSYPIVFSHNHFTPYLLDHLKGCGPRSLPMLLEIPFLNKILKDSVIDGCITQTESQRRWLLKKYELPKKTVKAIPPGYDANLIQSLHRYLNNGNPYNITFSGRVNVRKGVYELLEAFSLIVRNHPGWNLNFIGDGPARPKLEREVQKRKLEDRVVFWGRRCHREALDIVSNSDIFVLPSYIESISNSLLEAMALGVPSIATDLEAIKENMIDDGINGLLVPRKDPESLSHSLVRLIALPDYRQFIGREGQEKVRNWTLKRYLDETETFLIGI